MTTATTTTSPEGGREADNSPASAGSTYQARASLPGRAPRVSTASVIRAEWVKLRSVRSTVMGILAAGLTLLALGALFASFAGSGEEVGPPGTGTDPLSLSFAGMNISQLIIGVIGAVFVAGEYSTGLIRTMFAAVPRRLPVLWAKVIVAGGSAWVVMTIAAFGAFLAGQASYSGDLETYALSDAGVLRSVLGVGVYAAGVMVIGVALGFLLRSTAGAIGVLVTLLMIAPVLVGLLPSSLATTVSAYLPGNAGQALMRVVTVPDSLSPGAGLVVFGIWVSGLVIAAAVRLRWRDA